MQTSIAGVNPDQIEEIEEAAFGLARINEEVKALKKNQESAASVLVARMREHDLAVYSGHGVRCYLDTSIKAKVQVDQAPDEE